LSQVCESSSERLGILVRTAQIGADERAVFYRFDAIGPEGPLVEKVSLTKL
jgi:hypothetical protein